jgi:carbonic anhydrase
VRTDDLLTANQDYALTFDRGGLPMPPARHLAIVTCMDARILPHGPSACRKATRT